MQQYAFRASIAAVSLVVSLTVAAPGMAQDYAYFGASLLGDNVRGGGDDDATADFNGEADLETGKMCYYLEIDGLRNVVAAAIHEGGARDTGPAIVPLTLPPDPSDEVCITVDAVLLRTMAASPEEYYVAVINSSHPDGAIRGQIGS